MTTGRIAKRAAKPPRGGFFHARYNPDVPRLPRIFLNVGAAVSLVLGVAIAILWVASYFIRGSITVYPLFGQTLLSWIESRSGFVEVNGEHFIPYLFMMIPCIPIPLWWLLSRLFQTQPVPANRCPSCGYDLRATPDRCPECGKETLISN